MLLPVLALLVPTGVFLTGLDVLERDEFAELKGKRVGLITNQTGLDREGRRGVDVMRAAGVRVTALFSPEHGLFGREDREGLADAKDETTGIPVFSLYGDSRRPSPESLRDVDVLVFDMADAGVRFYTYETTMALGLESATAAKIPFYVLDRPDPITGTRVEGPPLDPENVSFTGYLAGTPVRHGLTIGELATLFDREKGLKADLHVVRMEGWRRRDWFDDTGFPWTNPSPNLRSLKAAILYPGVCLVEFARNLSVGRGTDAPFEQIGAEFLKGRDLAATLKARKLPGLRFYPVRFTPASDARLGGKLMEGIRIELTDRDRVQSVRLGIELACALQKLYPDRLAWNEAKRLIGSNDVVRRIAAGEDAETIEESYRPSVAAFMKRRAKALLYS